MEHGPGRGRLVLLDAARRDVKAPKLAYWLLAAGIAVTLVANVLAGVAFGVLGAVVAAWPALALVGSYELSPLMMMIRRARTAPETVADAVSIPALDEAPRTVLAVTPGPVADAAADHVPDAVRDEPKTVPPARGRRRPVNAHTRAERRYAAYVADGQVPSLRRLMRDLGVGQGRPGRSASTWPASPGPTGRCRMPDTNAEVIDFPGTPSDQAEPEIVAVVPERAEAIKGDHQRQPIVPEQWQRYNIRGTVSYLAMSRVLGTARRACKWLTSLAARAVHQ
jgi:hypothetical protein